MTERVRTTRQTMGDLLRQYPGVVANVVHGLDYASAVVNRFGEDWRIVISRVAADEGATEREPVSPWEDGYVNEKRGSVT